MPTRVLRVIALQLALVSERSGRLDVAGTAIR